MNILIILYCNIFYRFKLSIDIIISVKANFNLHLDIDKFSKKQ